MLLEFCDLSETNTVEINLKWNFFFKSLELNTVGIEIIHFKDRR